MIDDVIVASEDPVGDPVVAHEPPDVLLRIELGAFPLQSHDGPPESVMSLLLHMSALETSTGSAE